MTTLSNRKQIFALCLRLLGYGLLLISAVNLVCWFPLSFDPLQEFQAAGAVIERIPVTLLGMVLVCYCGRGDRYRVEAAVTPILPWFSLFLAIFLLTLIPLNVVNSLRVYSQSNISENTQFVVRDIHQFKQQLELANSRAELSAILQQQLKQPVELPKLINTQKLKQDIITTLRNEKELTISQSLAFREQKRSMLFKKCLRWNIGALIAAIWFILIGKSAAKTRLTKY